MVIDAYVAVVVIFSMEGKRLVNECDGRLVIVG